MAYEDQVICAFDIALEEIKDTIKDLNQDGTQAF